MGLAEENPQGQEGSAWTDGMPFFDPIFGLIFSTTY